MPIDIATQPRVLMTNWVDGWRCFASDQNNAFSIVRSITVFFPVPSPRWLAQQERQF